jgi:hypothetical protein
MGQLKGLFSPDLRIATAVFTIDNIRFPENLPLFSEQKNRLEHLEQLSRRSGIVKRPETRGVHGHKKRRIPTKPDITGIHVLTKKKSQTDPRAKTGSRRLGHELSNARTLMGRGGVESKRKPGLKQSESVFFDEKSREPHVISTYII